MTTSVNIIIRHSNPQISVRHVDRSIVRNVFEQPVEFTRVESFFCTKRGNLGTEIFKNTKRAFE